MSSFKPNYFQRRSKPQGPKANERIRALDVQVIGSEGGNLGAASAFIQYLLSPEVNSKMPVENSMYSVLEGVDLPEENGYRYHSIVPQQPAVVNSTTIANSMETWLSQWNSAMVDA